MNKKLIILGVTGAVTLCAGISAMANSKSAFTKVNGSSDYTVTLTPDARTVTTDAGNSAWINFDYNEDTPVSEDVFGDSLGFSVHTTNKFNFVKSIKLVVKALENPGGYISGCLAFNSAFQTYDIQKKFNPEDDIIENQEIVFDFSEEEQAGDYEVHVWNVVANNSNESLLIKSVSVTYTC